MLALLGSLGSALVVAQPADAATTLFVSAGGSNANPCSSAAPCATVTHALSLASSGDTIEVAGHILDVAVTVSTTIKIEQWPGQAPAVVDATLQGNSPVFLVGSGGNLTLDGITIAGGTASATDFGGGITNAGTVIVTDSTITLNRTSGNARAAGGIDNTGIATITDSTITGNTATAAGSANLAAGGLLNGPGGTATITASTITGNTASSMVLVADAGGGLVNFGTATITTSTITGNTATQPSAGIPASGGLLNFATATITASTITDNRATTSAGTHPTGGGITQLAGTIDTGATIVAANSVDGSPDNCDKASVASLTSVGYNLTDDTDGSACGFTQNTDQVNANPDLGPLANNGGPTETLLPAVTSPAVEAIPSPTTLNGISVCGPGAFDQRGVSRPIAGPNTSCTIGAVEVEGPAPPAPPRSLGGGARMTALPNGTGYWIVHSDGGVFSYGTAPFLGSLPGLGIHVNNIVGIAVTADGGGYWLVGSDGGVFSFGDASFFGSMGGKPLNQPVVAMAATPDGKGYWLVASDGGVFRFGDATFAGSMGGKPLNQPVVDMAADPAGGYWLVASDGGIFTFGVAPFLGSMGGTPLVEPVVGVTSAPGGTGYWLVASDGGVFAFGQARFVGSLAGSPLSSPVIGLYSTNLGMGYTVVEANGTAVGHF